MKKIDLRYQNDACHRDTTRMEGKPRNSVRVERATSTQKVCTDKANHRPESTQKEGVETHCKMQLQRKQKRPEHQSAGRRKQQTKRRRWRATIQNMQKKTKKKKREKEEKKKKEKKEEEEKMEKMEKEKRM